MKFEDIIRWTYEHRKSIGISVVLAIPVLVVIQFFASNAFIFVSVDTPVKSSALTTYGSTPSGTDKIGTTGLILISRDVKSIIVASGENLKTEKKLALPWYGLLAVDVRLERDKNADKVAFASPYSYDTCATYSKQLDSLLAYKCTNPPSLLQYQTPNTSAWINKALATKMYYPGKLAQPYMGGVIGVSVYARGDESAPQPIIYTTDTGEQIAYDMPEGINEATLSQSEVFSNYADPNDKRFAFVTDDGTTYIGSPTATKGAVDYVTVPAPKGYAETPHKTLCRVTTEKVYCYTGSDPIGDSTEPLKNDDKIRVYDFDGNITESTELQASLGLSGIYVTHEGKIYGRQFKKLLAFTKQNDSYKVEEISQNVDSAAGGDALYYAQRGGVYKIDTQGVAHQVFSSKKVSIATVYISDGQIFMLGTLKESTDKQIYAYTLRDDDNTTPDKRIIDILPTEPGQLPSVTAQNLVGKQLQLQLAVPFNKSGSGPGIGDSDSLLNEKKQAVINSLLAQGVPLNELSILYTY